MARVHLQFKGYGTVNCATSLDRCGSISRNSHDPTRPTRRASLMGLPIELTYLAASILFILGLKGLSHPETARRGMIFAEVGMFLAIVGTLLHREIISYEWIIAGLIIGSIIGGAMSIWVPMTAMPQRTALSHAFGALAASLVGVSEYYRHSGVGLGAFKMTALSLEVLLGGIAG